MKNKPMAILGGLAATAVAGALVASLRQRGSFKKGEAEQSGKQTGGGARGRHRADAENRTDRQHAQVDGIRMSWVEEGAGVPVILLHGIPTSPELWREVIPRVSDVRALAWEMVGYGESIDEGRSRNISVARQAEYLASWMRHLGLKKAIVVGHDLGGGVAQILAVRHPDLCRGLLLTNAIGYDSWPIPSVGALKATATVTRHLPRPLFKLLLMNLFSRGHDDAEKAKAAYHLHSRPYLERSGAADLIHQIECLDVNDTLAIADRLSDLNLPVRIVWGDADQFQTIEYAHRFVRDLNAPLRRIAGGKHFTPEDHPDVLAEEIMLLVENAHAPGEKPPLSGRATSSVP